MSRFFIRLLGFVLLIATVGLTTCQSIVKAEPESALSGPAFSADSELPQ